MFAQHWGKSVNTTTADLEEYPYLFAPSFITRKESSTMNKKENWLARLFVEREKHIEAVPFLGTIRLTFDYSYIFGDIFI